VKVEDIMLDQIGTIALFAAVVFDLGAVAAALTPFARYVLLAVAGLWSGLAVALAGGWVLVAAAGIGPVPPVGVMLLAVLVASAAAAALAPAVRHAMLALPLDLLIGVNILRVLGVFFLLLAAQHRLGGPFPYWAGWGDILTGLLAAPLAIAVARSSMPTSVAQAWNLLGTLDLIAAVTLGVTSANGSPLQVFDTGVPGPLAIQSLPWSLIPTVLVPFYLVVHGIIFAQLRQRRAPHPAARMVGAR
jgi:hypothetical protein